MAQGTNARAKGGRGVERGGLKGALPLMKPQRLWPSASLTPCNQPKTREIARFEQALEETCHEVFTAESDPQWMENRPLCRKFMGYSSACDMKLVSCLVGCLVGVCVWWWCCVLCCVVLCCAVLCCAVLCCAVLCCAVLCCAVLCCVVLCPPHPPPDPPLPDRPPPDRSKFRSFFFPLPPHFFSFCLSLGVFGFGAAGAPHDNPNAHQTPPKFHDKTPCERQKERKWGGEREKKAQNFGPPPFGPHSFGAPRTSGPQNTNTKTLNLNGHKPFL